MDKAGKFVFAGLCAVALTLVLGVQARAHVTNVSRSNIVIDGERLSYSLDLSPIDLAVATGLVPNVETPFTVEQFVAHEPEIVRYVLERVIIYGDGQACPAGQAKLNTAGLPRGVNLTWAVTCPPGFRTFLLQYLVFSEVDSHHATVGRIVSGQGATDFTIGGSSPELSLALATIGEGPFDQAWRFLGLGIEHILIGYDHILFLLGLIVASLGWRYLLSVITMFTLAHTLTLLLAAFGWVTLPGRLVESVIALSIAWVAAENLLGWGMRWRWAITFGFGLVHGLGFASVLSQLTQGSEVHLASLFTFNLGVEAGQLTIVAAVLPALLLTHRYGFHRRVMQIMSLSILIVSLYWFGQRALWG